MCFSCRWLTGLTISVAAAASLVCAGVPVGAQEAVLGADTDALGLRRGSFVFLPNLALRTGYSDNLDFASGPARSGSLSEIEGGLQVRSDWSRHALSVDLKGSATAPEGEWSAGDHAAEARLATRLDIYRDSTLRLEGGYLFSGDADISDHVYGGELAYAHRFNRLTVTLTGGAQYHAFRGDRSTQTEATEAAVSDYRELRGAVRTDYELSPLTSLFAEAELNRRVHSPRRDGAGNLRDSDGYEVAVGAAWSNGSKLSGELSVGYLAQHPVDAALAKVTGVTFDSRLLWRPTALTEVALSAGTEAGETTLTGSGGYMLRSAGVEVRHALRRHLVLSGGLAYERADYAGLSLVEQTREARLGLDYLLSRYLTLSAEATHTRFDSSQPGSDYRANTVMVGAVLRR